MIRDLKSGEKLTAQQLAERLAQAPRVLVGEQRDNPNHHALELWILQVLADRRAQGSLLLEMLDPSQQFKVDEVKAGFKSIAHADIPAALAWREGWSWALYGPIVRYALGQPYPLLSVNPDLEELDASSAHLPEEHALAMTAVQQQRGWRMAQQLLLAPTPVLFFADTSHVRKDIGVPVHLIDLGVGDGTLVLLLAEVGAHVPYSVADYVWYTAAPPERGSSLMITRSEPE